MSEESDSKKEKEDLIKKQTTNLEQTIKDTAKELEELQKSCLHPKESHKIKDINPEGSSDIRKVCGLCNHIMGYPTKDEMDEWTGNKKEKTKY